MRVVTTLPATAGTPQTAAAAPAGDSFGALLAALLPQTGAPAQPGTEVAVEVDGQPGASTVPVTPGLPAAELALPTSVASPGPQSAEEQANAQLTQQTEQAEATERDVSATPVHLLTAGVATCKPTGETTGDKSDGTTDAVDTGAPEASPADATLSLAALSPATVPSATLPSVSMPQATLATTATSPVTPSTATAPSSASTTAPSPATPSPVITPAPATAATATPSPATPSPATPSSATPTAQTGRPAGLRCRRGR